MGEHENSPTPNGEKLLEKSDGIFQSNFSIEFLLKVSKFSKSCPSMSAFFVQTRCHLTRAYFLKNMLEKYVFEIFLRILGTGGFQIPY